MFFSSQYRLPHRSKLAMESKRRHFPSPKLCPFRYLWPSSWSRLRIARRSPASRAARPSPSPKNTRRPRRNRASECNCLFSHKTHPSIPNRHDPHPVFLLAPSSACVLPVKQVLICRACKIKKLEFIEDELSSLLPLPLQRSLHQIVVSSHLRSILAIMNRVIFLSTTMFTRAKKRGLDMQHEIGRKHCSARFFFRLDPRIFESMGYCFECCSRVGFVATNLKSELEMFTFSFFGLARSIRINYLRIMRKANINICENENKRAEPVQIVCFKLFAIFLSSVI